MKIVIVGGGPGGLYFALLMKKRYPDYDVAVYERNRADDTFGFGVVFSDETLDNLMDYDAPSYQAITREFSYWDEAAEAVAGRSNHFAVEVEVDVATRREQLIAPSVNITDIEKQLKAATTAMSLLTGLYDHVSRVLAGR
jgi:2-polyprenyl-6-methoxyphenol hydroxylase-like FAD-dependent oxidoreductase